MKSKQITLVTGKTVTLSGREIFVTMTDKFMSGWGLAENKVAKRVIICNNLQQAKTIEDRLLNPKHLMKHVNIVYNMPKYSQGRYTVSWDQYEDSLFNF